MNRREQRALRAIEKNIKIDDPAPAAQLRSFGGDGSARRKWYAAAFTLALLLIGANTGSSALLLAGLLLALVLGLKWTFQALR